MENKTRGCTGLGKKIRGCAGFELKIKCPPALASMLTVVVLIVSLIPLDAETLDKREIVLETKIVSATIYSREGQIIRRGKLDVGPGQYSILCDDLPGNFDESSIQVEGRGTARAQIIGIEKKRLWTDTAETPRYGELKEKLEMLEFRRDSLNIHMKSIKERIEFLGSLARFPLEKGGEKLAPEIFRVDDWKRLIDFLDVGRIEADQSRYRLAKQIDQLSNEIKRTREQLDAIQLKSDRGWRLVIDCDVKTPGDLTLDLLYRVQAVGWTPGYVVRYDIAEEKIDLSYKAGIVQLTGEDWRDVSLTLSTAMPHTGAAPPVIDPYELRKIPSFREGIRMQKESPPGIMKADEELHVRGGRPSEIKLDLKGGGTHDAVHAVTGIATSSFSANFNVPVPVDLESGRDPRRVMIMQGELPGELSRSCVPRLSKHVFTSAAVTNSLDAPILPGIAEVYIDTDTEGSRTSTFVGRESIGPVAPEEKFDLHLGVDQDIKVNFKLEKKEYLSKEGKSKRKVRYHFTAELESFKKNDTEVTVKDRVPVSYTKEIKVGDIDLTPPPSERLENGIVTWDLKLIPGSKSRISIAYTIEFPGDWPDHYINLE